MLFMIRRYLPLVEDWMLATVALACLLSIFLVSFLLVPGRNLPPKLPVPMRLMYRLGLGLCGTGWVIGLGGVANGYNTPIFVRDVPVVAKHESLERDRTRRSHSLLVRPWSGSRRVQDIDVSIPLYDALAVPVSRTRASYATLEAMPDSAQIRLVLGQGRLGLDWIKSVELLK
jgi:hypothetical protein